MRKLILFSIAFSLISNASASCLDKYQSSLAAIKNEKAGVSDIGEGMAFGLMPASFCAMGGAMGLPGWIFAGVCFVSIEVTFGTLNYGLKTDRLDNERAELRTIVAMLENNLESNDLQDFAGRVNAKRSEGLSIEEIAFQVRELSYTNSLCTENKLLTLEEIGSLIGTQE